MSVNKLLLVVAIAVPSLTAAPVTAQAPVVTMSGGGTGTFSSSQMRISSELPLSADRIRSIIAEHHTNIARGDTAATTLVIVLNSAGEYVRSLAQNLPAAGMVRMSPSTDDAAPTDGLFGSGVAPNNLGGVARRRFAAGELGPSPLAVLVLTTK